MFVSEDYRKQQAELHTTGVYGTLGKTYAPFVAQVMTKLQVTHMLDYGCGSNLSLPKALADQHLVEHKFKYQAYDPCVEQYAAPPVPAELVVCIDVLEHIEEEYIEGVLDHLRDLTEAVGFFTLDTGPALKTLSDGRNAHVLQRPVEWWLPRLICRFDLQTYQTTWKSPYDPSHWKSYVVVTARPRSIEGTDGSKLSQ